MTTLKLEIVSPDRLVLAEEVEELQIPGKAGYMGILPGHIPLVTELDIGEMSYKKEGESHYVSIVFGYCEISSDRINILAEKAEKAGEIDLSRAEESHHRAEERLSNLQATDIDFERAASSLKRAKTRMEVSKKTGSAHSNK